MDQNIWLDGMMGLIVGDACGVPVEFKSREELRRDPVVDMREYGTHKQPKGTWSDDSSMALANLKSLQQGYDLKDIAEQFARWFREGRYTPFGKVFDIGINCARAILAFQATGDPRHCGVSGERDNGNGSLMRILPMCLYAYEKECAGELGEKEAVAVIHDVSAITHAHLRSMMACGLYYFCVKAILDHKAEKTFQECLQEGFDRGFAFYRQDPENLPEAECYGRLADLAAFREAEEDTVRSSGYVVDTLEAAIWSILQSDSYEECVLKAVNLGKDTDTVGAVVGGLAGLYYGVGNIPEAWRECIVEKEWITELCDCMHTDANVHGDSGN